MSTPSHPYATSAALPQLDALHPTPGSAEEQRRFAELQRRLKPVFQQVFPNPLAEQTVVVVPSLTMDADELTKLSGATHYEERLLCMLMLLRLPRTHLIYVTSQPIPSVIVDYYLHLLPGVPLQHARRRLTLISCYDGANIALTAKLLARPRLIQRIRAAIADPHAAHMTCFNATPLERTLAVQLGIPLYACDPSLYHLGTKSGSRSVFRQAGVPHPAGAEHLRDTDDLLAALTELKQQHPTLRRVVIKLNDGFSGEGNAVFSMADAPTDASLQQWIERELVRHVQFEAQGESWERYAHKFTQMGGVVEAFIEGDEVRSPSVQCRIDPLGQIQIISSHDQVLGGPTGQIFLGCTFPADPDYCTTIHQYSLQIARVLQQQGVLGRFGIDFVSVRRGDQWEHAAIEINLRKGGTTHPYLMLQFLTDGTYDAERGMYHTLTGQPCFYYASDNLQSTAYAGLTPDDLIDVAVEHGLHFDTAAQQGVVFHLIGALSQFGKLGTLCIGDSRERARDLYGATVTVLDRVTQQARTTAV